jgi:hypothetical protein
MPVAQAFLLGRHATVPWPQAFPYVLQLPISAQRTARERVAACCKHRTWLGAMLRSVSVARKEIAATLRS